MTVDDEIYIHTTRNMDVRRNRMSNYIRYQYSQDDIRSKLMSKVNGLGEGYEDHITYSDIETYDFSDNHELRVRGRYWIEELGATLNEGVMGREKREYDKDNRDMVLFHKKKSYHKNIEENRARQRELYMYNKENETESYRRRKERYELNKEAIRARCLKRYHDLKGHDRQDGHGLSVIVERVQV